VLQACICYSGQQGLVSVSSPLPGAGGACREVEPWLLPAPGPGAGGDGGELPWGRQQPHRSWWEQAFGQRGSPVCHLQPALESVLLVTLGWIHPCLRANS